MTLKEQIQVLEFENLTILEISDRLHSSYDLSMISKTVKEIRSLNQLKPENTFGNCGIYPEANPCGDACEY